MRSSVGGVLRLLKEVANERFLRFSWRSRSMRIFLAIAESDCGFLTATRLLDRGWVGAGRLVVGLLEDCLAFSFCLAIFKSALTNWSFRIECQPSMPFFFASWARSLDFWELSEAAVIKILTPSTHQGILYVEKLSVRKNPTQRPLLSIRSSWLEVCIRLDLQSSRRLMVLFGIRSEQAKIAIEPVFFDEAASSLWLEM